MMKRVIFGLIVLVALFGVLASSSDARLKTDTRIDQATQAKKVPVHDGMTGSALTANANLQRYAPVGTAASPHAVNSRGALIGQTWRDWQENSSIGRLVTTNPPSVGTPGVHFVWMNASLPGDYGPTNTKNQMAYSYFDPQTGTYPIPGGLTIQDASSGSTERGDYPKVIAHPATGAAIVGGFDWENRSTGVNDWRYHVYFDLIPGTGTFGTIADGSSMSAASMDSGGVRSRWPRFAMTVTSTDTVLYLAGIGNTNNEVKVYRKLGTKQMLNDTAWHFVYTDTTFFPTTDVACDPTSMRVAVTWTNLAPVGGLYDVYYADSPTGLPGTWTKHDLTNYVGAGYSAWLETCIMFDSAGKLHIMWPAGKSDDGNGFTDRARIFHWSEWQPTKKYLVYNAEYDANLSPCGGLTSNVFNVGKVTFGECDNKLYAVFTSWNDPISGHLDDCQKDNVRANGENWVCVSKTLDGISWDAPRNLSNSYTPNCDTGECADDLYNSIALYGMDDAAFPGVENWTNAYTYDLGTGYTGTKFTQVFYHTDRVPGGAYIPQGPTSLNDQRWIRLACVEPVTAARLDVSPSYIGYPQFTKPNTTKNYTLDLTNVGNTLLTFTGLSSFEDSSKGPGAPATGWLSFSGLPASINEAETKQMTLTLNCNAISQIGTVLYGHLRYSFTTPATNQDYLIEFRVTDSIVYTTWDTVSTACTDLAVGTNGNMGQNAAFRVNMDYYGPGECDTGPNGRGDSRIYLYDGSPVIIRTVSPTVSRASWSIYSDGFQSIYGFKPLTGAGFAPHGSFSSASYDGFNSGTFTTVDSLVRIEKTWWAPKNADSCNFVIQRMRIFSSTIASPVTGLIIGEYFDIDVPTDSGSANNVAGTDATRRLAYQRGFNSADTVTDCVDNSKRYAGVALLNWHMKNKSCFDSVYAVKVVNNTAMQGGGALNLDSLKPAMHVAGYTAEPTIVDLATMMTYKDGPSGYTLPANDTLTIYSAIATTRANAPTTAAGLDSLKRYIDKAKNFLKTNLGVCASCCQGVTGNVNMTGIVDLSDLSALVSYLTGGGYVLPCASEANVNNAGIVDLSDLSALVSYLTGGGYVLPNCP